VASSGGPITRFDDELQLDFVMLIIHCNEKTVHVDYIVTTTTHYAVQLFPLPLSLWSQAKRSLRLTDAPTNL